MRPQRRWMISWFCDHGKLPGLLSHAAGERGGRPLQGPPGPRQGIRVCGEFRMLLGSGMAFITSFIFISPLHGNDRSAGFARPISFFHYSAELRYKKSENEMIRSLAQEEFGTAQGLPGSCPRSDRNGRSVIPHFFKYLNFHYFP